MSMQTFYRTVKDTSREADQDFVEGATAAVFHALRDRLTVEESDQVLAQLPRELKKLWAEGDRPARKPIKMHRDEFLERVMAEAGLPSPEAARWMVLAIFTALEEQISPGEAGDVVAQLPTDLKELWQEAQAA